MTVLYSQVLLFGFTWVQALSFFVPVTALGFSSGMSQEIFDVNAQLDEWRITLSNDWDVLGPFPVHAREQHFISPGSPLNLTSPYHHEQNGTWPSSLSEKAEVTWRKVRSDSRGNLNVQFPDVRWSKIRATEGWAGLQHHSVLHTSLVVQPPRFRNPNLDPPRIRVQLTEGSFFAILTRESSGMHPEWHTGNIYTMNRAPPSTVELPGLLDADKPTTFDFFVSGDYEIRLFGDPRDEGGEIPALRMKIEVGVEEKLKSVVRQESHDVICDFVDGFAFGDALGVGLRSVDGWWTVSGLKLSENPPTNLTLSIVHSQIIAPSQTRVIPISIKQTGIFNGEAISINIILTEHLESGSYPVPGSISVPITLTVRRLPPLDISNIEIRATFFFASAHPTYLLAQPPLSPSPNGHSIPVLALHGAGVDIIANPFWADAIPRQKHSWIIMPIGRTEWGLDWHGPSASEAWQTIPALSAILNCRKDWQLWSFPSNSRVVILGHSNGGQGAWYTASRFPDRTRALLPAAGYLSAAAYVPLTQARGARFADPALRSVLESSFIPDDNALFLGNLANNIPVLAVHGGNDTNVPTWHSREYVSIIKSWGKGLDVSFHEDEGQPHWYQNVFTNEPVRKFLENALESKVHSRGSSKDISEFTLTVADAVRSGSLNGCTIEALIIPGRLARLHVQLRDGSTHIRTINVRRFSVGPDSHCLRGLIIIDGTQLLREPQSTRQEIFALSESGAWHKEDDFLYSLPSVPPGRVQNILDTAAPLTIVIPSKPDIYPSVLSAALRISHALDVYVKLDSEILLDTDAVRLLETSSGNFENVSQNFQGNLIILCGEENALSRKLLQVPPSYRQTEFGISESGEWLFRNRPLSEVDRHSGILFTHPHPMNPLGSAVFISGSCRMSNMGTEGLERVLRLFVPRTGIAVPDWIIVGKEVDNLGAGGVIGAGVWDSTWKWSEAMSYLT